MAENMQSIIWDDVWKAIHITITKWARDSEELNGDKVSIFYLTS
jgi:hypothetical protein